MQLVRERLLALKEELSDIQETETEMAQVLEHFDALQTILLGSAEKLKLSFSSVTAGDLSKMGLQQKSLRFKKDAELVPADLKHIQSLGTQIMRIRRSASRRHEAGARMILDAFLLTIADVSLGTQERRRVAIFPEMAIASGDGVLVENKITGFQMWLTGSADYGICVYDREEDRARVLGAKLEDLMRYAKNWIFLVEAKHEQEMLADNLPEATSQAIALAEVTGKKTVRYCLSDGREWMFALCTKDDQGNHVSYDGPVLSIREPALDAQNPQGVQEAFEMDVRYLVEVLFHWLTVDTDPAGDTLCDLE